MSKNWITAAEAVTIISKNSHHSVSPHHIQTLVNRGKIGTRSSDGETTFLKLSDVEATRVAVSIGNVHHKDRGDYSRGGQGEHDNRKPKPNVGELAPLRGSLSKQATTLS